MANKTESVEEVTPQRLREIAETIPGHHTGITPWAECLGCTIDHAAAALQDAERRLVELDAAERSLRSLVPDAGNSDEWKSGATWAFDEIRRHLPRYKENDPDA